MPSSLIPKEALTAYQRWELATLDEAQGGASATGEAMRRDQPALNLPTAEDVERIHQQAAQDGHRVGREEGYKAGYQAGRKAGEAHAGLLKDLAAALDAERLRQDETLSREVLDLALAVARQILRSAVRVKEGVVVEAIREALGSLPSLSGHIRILVHPDDVDTVREFMAAEHGHFSVRVAGDAAIEQAGFRLESNHSEVDGRLPVRWREIIDCLGVDDEWLE